MLAATLNFIDEQGLEADQRAGGPRIAIDRPSTVRPPARAPLDVTVQDLSSRGFRFVSAADLPIGTTVRVGLNGAGAQDARIVRRDGAAYGCAFLEPLSAARMATAFGAATVVKGAFPIADNAVMPEPATEKWPGSVRLAILAGSSIALWAGLLAGAGAILR
ncbi:PilZ domain-containing protein [Sphingomonas solaris]|uniref:PilZ domain-containing protein n=1 Tax=Alterirhizorhabdus solaris TaxID=2529389 RepID=A0A558R0J4_9SPHN|nr:PilZ domain-containing protein [Sphingomonas solaris]TVV72915.1 hypothetical protein FOY91_13200 [Sphingomonas solaris]